MKKLCIILIALLVTSFFSGCDFLKNEISVTEQGGNISSSYTSYSQLIEDARDEDYWANIPDTPESDLEYFYFDEAYVSGAEQGEPLHTSDEPTESTIGVHIKGVCDTFSGSVLKIPSEINGYEVKSIEKFIPCIYENGFLSGKYAETVKEIYIPDTVRLEADLPIAEHAEKLRFPQDSSISGAQISSLYAELKILILPKFADDDSEVVCNLTTNPGKMENLEELYFSEGLTKIRAFGDSLHNLDNLKTVAIPSSVTKIDGLINEAEKEFAEVNIFKDCDNLTIICEQGSYAQEYAKKYGIKTQII